ncbi:hypothetical protein ABFX02_10G038000 [Erythranthe guttata]
MNTLNPAAAKLIARRPPLVPSLNSSRPSSFKPLSPLSLRFPPPPLRRLSLSPKAYLHEPNRKTDNREQKASGISFLAPLRTAVVTSITAAALLLTGFYFSGQRAIASPISPPLTETESTETETTETNKDSIMDEERERLLEEELLSNPDNVDVLKNLMEAKIKSRKLPEAIEIMDKLIELEPDEVEWPMMKAHLYAYDGNFESARNGFNELLEKDPARVEAYHGLVTVASQEESSEDLVNIETRVEEAMKLCKEENKGSDLRDFKLLIAQIKVLDGNYEDALIVYQDLVKEEPRDFRPYLCQGIIYTLLKKNGEAEKNFEKYRRLVPKGHPYASYFDDNMIATKLFAQKVENERAMSKN